MTTFNGQVTANADDGYTYPGTFTVSDIAIGYDGDYNNAFARFLNVTIPKGAIISSAKIQYKAGTSTTPINMQSSIYANKVVSPTSPTSEATYSAKTLTTAFVNWDSFAAWVSGTWYDSPDISSVIQEIINQTSWVSGNPILIMHKNRRVASPTGYAEIQGYETGSANAPKLVITYTLNNKDGSFAVTGNTNNTSSIGKKNGKTTVTTSNTNNISVTGSAIDANARAFRMTNTSSITTTRKKGAKRVLSVTGNTNNITTTGKKGATRLLSVTGNTNNTNITRKKGAKSSTTNYALNRYTNQPVWNNEVYSTDGNTDMNYYTATTTGLQYFDVDLGEIKLINLIKLWHYYESSRIYYDVIVQISPDDPSFVTNFTTVFNNDIDNSAGFGVGSDAEYGESSLGKSITFPARPTRYLRFYSNGNNKNAWNHIVEIQAFCNTLINTSSSFMTIEISGGSRTSYLKVFPYDASVFTTNGLCVLHEPISARLIEELNGSYEVDVEYPLDTSGKWLNLEEDNIIKADGQLFRIYHPVKTVNSIKVNARHIFYDLMDNFLEDVSLTALNGAAALDWMLTHTQYEHNFISVSDIAATGTWSFVHKNPVQAIMGSEGIMEQIGGELERDNFTIKLHQSRGMDRGVLVAYAKNIQGIEVTGDYSNIITRILPVGKDNLMLPAKYVDSPYIGSYAHPKVAKIDFPDIDNVTDLEIAANDYILYSQCDVPEFNYKVDFVELTKTEEYKDYMILETVYMGDTVTVRHNKLNIDLKAKVIRIEKNLITGRIDKIELGSFKPNIGNINKEIKAMQVQLVQTQSDFAIAVANATKLITGAERGHIVIRQDENSYPYELLIMDTNNMATAKKVWRWNIEGLGHSNNGIEGPYDLAITADGSIVATFITSGILNASLLKTGSIVSTDGSINISLATGEFTIGGQTGDVATHTNTYSKWMHGTNDYTIAQASGLIRHSGTLNKDYHYLMDTGEKLTSDANRVLVTVDPAFKGKKFVVTVAVMDTENPIPYNGETMVGYTAYVDEETYDYANGTVYVYGWGTWYDARNLIGDQILGISRAENYYSYVSGLRLTWTAIG